MNQPNNIANRAEDIRRMTLDLLLSLEQKSSAFALPALPPELGKYRDRLRENTYQVLVAGEAKRGKSTFVNALIGRDILPTDVDVATCQVFRICPAEREGYRLRFEDDTEQAITADDLPRYGSQVVADQQGTPRLDQIIRWIEVDVPVRFLPSNIRLLDTPGLGGLYAAHTQITYRFVPHADAVIFVLDSQAPIGQPEVEFVDQLLKVTRSILFIQTRIDQFTRDAWEEIQRRNQEILRQRFADRLADTRVWPISSTNLRKAAATGDDDYLLVSRHRQLAAALHAFLARVAGWSRTAEAILLAGYCHGQFRKVLEGRLERLLENSKQDLAAIQQRATEERRQFELDWGDRGQKRRELLEEIQKAATLAKQDFRQSLQAGGAIETAQRERIESLQSVDDAKRFGENLAERLVAEASSRWREICLHFQTRCAGLVGPFLASTSVMSLSGQDESALSIQSRRPLEITNDWWTKVKGARMEYFQTFGMATSIASLLGGALWCFVITTSWFPPVAFSGILAASLWGLTQGWKSATTNQIKAARLELQRHLTTILQEIRRHFFDVDSASGRFSRVDEYFNNCQRGLADHMDSSARAKLEQARVEINRLVEGSRLNDQQRKARREEVRVHLDVWDQIGGQIKAIQTELQDLESGRMALPPSVA